MNNQEEQNNTNSLSAGLAERFIVYLQKLFSDEKQKVVEEKKAEAGQRIEETISKLQAVLNKEGGIEARDEDFDLEEKLASKWQMQVKDLRHHWPAGIHRSNRIKSGGKDKLKLLPRPNFNFILPINDSRSGKSGFSRLKTPLSVKMATLITIAFIVSVFIGLAQPQLAADIAAKSDSIINYPLDQIIAAAGVDEYKINTNFFKNLNKILAENKKIKSSFIVENRDMLDTAENSRKNFLITGDELIGLPVKASADDQNGKNNSGYDWQETIDIFIWKISQAIENSISFINKNLGR